MKELLAMDRAEIETQVGVDVKTLQAITPILDDLERRWLEARKSVGARTRGYFTPEEDDLVRQLLLSYRNCRIELINIIQRCYRPYAVCKVPATDPHLRACATRAGQNE